MIKPISFPSDPSQEVRLKEEQVVPILEQMLVKKSMFQFDASVAAKRIVETDLFGIPSHGCMRFGEYLDAMDVGDIDPRGRVLVQDETDVITVMDGSRAIGHVAATKGMESAIAKARTSGVGITAVGNSQTLGSAFPYVRMAAEHGDIGICLSSTGGATVAGLGTLQGAVGNTAFAYGVPVEGASPLIFDSACGTESWGKLELLRRYGLPIPPGIGFGTDGQEVDTPEDVKVLAPAGGELGFGLSLLCSVLAGPLSQGRMPIQKTRSASAEDSQHFFIVFNIENFNSPERFQKNLQNGLNAIRELEPIDPAHPVRLPGERNYQCFDDYSVNGIPFQVSIIEDLKDRAEKLGVSVSW